MTVCKPNHMPTAAYRITRQPLLSTHQTPYDKLHSKEGSDGEYLHTNVQEHNCLCQSQRREGAKRLRGGGKEEGRLRGGGKVERRREGGGKEEGRLRGGGKEEGRLRGGGKEEGKLRGGKGREG